MRQVKALAGSAPVSGSLAVPAKLMTSPPAYSVLAGGAVMVTVGGMFAVTVNVAALLVAEPTALVTTARKVAPLSVVATDAMVKLAAVAPAMLAPLRCH